MKKKSKIVIHYILIYILLIFQGSNFFKESQDYFYIGVVVLGVFMIATKRLKIDDYYLKGLLILFILLIMEMVITGGSLSFGSVMNVISRFILIQLAYLYDKNKFAARYIKTIAFFSVVSLIFFVIQITNIDLLRSILSEYEYSYNQYYGKFIYCIAPDHLEKNVGIYAEPGLHQVVLCSALYIVMFMRDGINITDKERKLYIILFAITLVTAQSTTGYISAIILFAGFVLKTQSVEISKYKKWLVIAIAVFLIWDISRGNDGFIYANFVNKMFDTSGQMDLSVSTGAARLDSIEIDMAIANKYPFGAGYTNYQNEWHVYAPYTNIYSVSGLTTTVAVYGYLITAYILGFYLTMMRKSNKDWFSIFIYMVIFVNVSLGQPTIFFPALMILLILEHKTVVQRELSI